MIHIYDSTWSRFVVHTLANMDDQYLSPYWFISDAMDCSRASLPALHRVSTYHGLTVSICSSLSSMLNLAYRSSTSQFL